VIDTIGLVTPEVLTLRRSGRSADEAMMELLKQKRPDYAILFPDRYPRSVRMDLFEPVHRVVLQENVICGGDEMVVFRLDWEDFDALEESARRTLEPGVRGAEGGSR
jgi:hypothetical protein